MKEESFWKQYFKTLNRHKFVAAATFSLVVGSFGATTFRGPQGPAFYAEGVLVDNEPVVAVSETSLQVIEQGKGIINEELLLSDILLEAIPPKLRDEDISLNTLQLVEKTRIEIDEVKLTNAQSAVDTDEDSSWTGKVTIRFADEDAEVAETTLRIMMAAMVELSEATNEARLERLSEELTAKVSQIESSIQEDTTALQAADEDSERALLEKQIEQKEKARDEAIARLTDAQLAETEIVSSLAIAKQPFAISNEPEESNTLSVMASGVSTAVLVVGWLIFGLSYRTKDEPTDNGTSGSARSPKINNHPSQYF